MSRYPHKNLPLKKPKFDSKLFETKKPSRLASKRAPLKLTVNSESKRAEVEAETKEEALEKYVNELAGSLELINSFIVPNCEESVVAYADES